MFSKLLNKLSPGKSGAPPHFERLQKSFDPLDSVEKGLSEKILRFIRTGENPELLLWLQNSSAVNGDLIYRPGRLFWPIHDHTYTDKQLRERAEKAVVFRNEFYSLMGPVAKAELAAGELNAIHALIRLAHLLQAVDKGVSLQRSGADAPEWLLYLLNDLHYASCSYEAPRKEPPRDGWSLRIVQKIVEEAELPLNIVVSLTFECKDVIIYMNRMLRMMQWEGTFDWLVEHEAIVHQAWKKLSAGGKEVFVSTIAKHEQFAAVFSPLLIQLAVDKAKGVRELARTHLNLIPPAEKQKQYAALLKGGGSAEKISVVQLLELEGSKASRALLEGALEQKPGKALGEAIQSSLSRMATVSDSPQVLPEPPAIVVPQDPPLSNSVLNLMLENWRELRIDFKRQADEEIERNKSDKSSYKFKSAQENWEEFRHIDETLVRQMFVQVNHPDEEQNAYSRNKRRIISHANRIVQHPEITLRYLLNIIHLTGSILNLWSDRHFQRWLQTQDDPSSVDLRYIAAMVPGQKRGLRGVALAALTDHWNAPPVCEVLKNDAVWPFFAEHPEYLEEAMGLRPIEEGQSYRFKLCNALQVINTFPQILSQYIAPILNTAFGDTKTNRLEAQTLASKLPGIDDTIIVQLGSTKQNQRILAAEWLERIQAKAAVPALFAQLNIERSEVVRGALLKVLESLGADISPYLSPAVLLKEAAVGLSKKPPAALSWFPFSDVPSAHWKADGKAVAPEVLQWWMVFAFKLKSPGQNPLIERYLDLLEPKDASRFSSFVLHRFVEEDTRRPSAEEAAEYAQANAQQRYASNQRWAQHYPEHAKTYEQCFEELRKDRASQYFGSAISCKGLLALTSRTPAHELVKVVRGFLRDHYLRIAQTGALIEVCAGSDDPLVIQLLLSIARRYRAAGIQEMARTIVGEIAVRNSWTQDQLADRTIPTAGYGENGALEIDYAGRQFTARLDAALKPELRNSEGKIVKALPAARKDDDGALIKEAMSLWSQSKKELKQVIQLQTARLYESMCTGRLWPVAEWQEYLYKHPVMNRLIQQLVWLQTDEHSVMTYSFRPSEDGSLLNTEDEEVDLTPGSFIRIAHGSLLDGPVQKAWLAHFKDYKVTSLFAQLSRGLPVLSDKQLKAHSIEDHKGWVSDAFTIRGHLTKLGYQRAAAEDAGFFDHYFKEFSGADVRVCIYFSGNCLPEENVTATVTRLEFEQMNNRAWGENRYAIEKVPPVLLGESYADYVNTAKAGVFDENWEKKMPW